MRFLIIALLASCGMTQRPVDILGKGTMCENLTQSSQRCYRGSDGSSHVCKDSGGRWTCEAE